MTNKPRLLALICGVSSVVVAVVVAACGGSSSANNGVIITPIVSLPEPTATVDPAAPSVTNQLTASQLRGFVYPIVGGCLPKGDQLMPGAPRSYRNGIHEGVDLYGVDNCTAITKGTNVIAAKAGRVIRADLNYVDVTAADVAQYQADPNNPASLDKFRGRQVWIDHGNGIVTRYCHLGGIAPGIAVGSQVTQGQLIAFVGESGTPESVTNPGSEIHLHFEARVGDIYLGAGMAPAQARALYVTFFAP